MGRVALSHLLHRPGWTLTFRLAILVPTERLGIGLAGARPGGLAGLGTPAPMGVGVRVALLRLLAVAVVAGGAVAVGASLVLGALLCRLAPVPVLATE